MKRALRPLWWVWNALWLGIASAVCIRGCSKTLEILDPKPAVIIQDSFNSFPSVAQGAKRHRDAVAERGVGNPAPAGNRRQVQPPAGKSTRTK